MTPLKKWHKWQNHLNMDIIRIPVTLFESVFGRNYNILSHLAVIFIYWFVSLPPVPLVPLIKVVFFRPINPLYSECIHYRLHLYSTFVFMLDHKTGFGQNQNGENSVS